jgi:hypothetical protein
MVRFDGLGRKFFILLQGGFKCLNPVYKSTKHVYTRIFGSIRSRGHFGAAERRYSSALWVFRFRGYYYPPNFTGPWPKVGQIWYGLDAYDPYLSPAAVPISFQKIARGGHRARRRSAENLKMFQENKKTSDPSKVELYNRRTRSQQAIHALNLMSRWYLVTGGLHASPRVARSAPPTT